MGTPLASRLEPPLRHRRKLSHAGVDDRHFGSQVAVPQRPSCTALRRARAVWSSNAPAKVTWKSCKPRPVCCRVPAPSLRGTPLRRSGTLAHGAPVRGACRQARRACKPSQGVTSVNRFCACHRTPCAGSAPCAGGVCELEYHFSRPPRAGNVLPGHLAGGF